MAGPFQEYPKLMRHPDNKPAVWRQLEGKGTGLFAPDTVLVSSEKLPDVTVVNKGQEQQYAARGYRPTNSANLKEYEQAILEQSPVSGYLDVEYPKWKYHAVKIPQIVNSKQEESALGPGWDDVPVIATEDDIEEEAKDGNPNQETIQQTIDRRTRAWKEQQSKATA